MGQRIFVFVGHPAETSFSHGLAEAYKKGAEAAGAEVRTQALHGMQFDPVLKEGYRVIQPLEPCREEWQNNIRWATHLAWFYLYWWGGMPAQMKGVIDRAFLPGFAMKYHKNDPWWDRLLAGRSADVVITADTPGWFDRLMYGKPGRLQVANLVLKFAGVKPVRSVQFGSVKLAKPGKIKSWLARAEKMGAKAAAL